MKKLFILLIITFNSYCQSEIDGRVTYEAVVEQPGLNKSLIFSNLKAWAAKNMDSQKANLDLDDLEAGRLVYRSGIESRKVKAIIGDIDSGWFNFDLTFLIKDEKFKVVLTDIYHAAPEFSENNSVLSNGAKVKLKSCGPIENEKCKGKYLVPTNIDWRKMKVEFNDAALNLIESLKNTVNSDDMDF